MLQVIQAFVRQAMAYIDGLPDKESQVSLIKTLQTVTEGKVRRNTAAAASSQRQQPLLDMMHVGLAVRGSRRMLSQLAAD
jgi:hypothetical protein